MGGGWKEFCIRRERDTEREMDRDRQTDRQREHIVLEALSDIKCLVYGKWKRKILFNKEF